MVRGDVCIVFWVYYQIVIIWRVEHGPIFVLVTLSIELRNLSQMRLICKNLSVWWKLGVSSFQKLSLQSITWYVFVRWTFMRWNSPRSDCYRSRMHLASVGLLKDKFSQGLLFPARIYWRRYSTLNQHLSTHVTCQVESTLNTLVVKRGS